MLIELLAGYVVGKVSSGSNGSSDGHNWSMGSAASTTLHCTKCGAHKNAANYAASTSCKGERK
jgi:hypothetical protein